MKKKIILLTIVVTAASYGFINKQNNDNDENPLLVEWNTPFGVPPFDKIKPEHYLPAFKVAIKQQEQEIEAIVNCKDAPTFANTIEAYEHTGELLIKIENVFDNLMSANSNAEMRKIAKEVSPILSTHADNISLNPKLWQRIKAVYLQKDKLTLTAEQTMLLENTYKDFKRAGADLDADKQKRLREINQELSLLSLKFGDNILNENNSFKLIVDNKADLDGMPQSIIDEGAQTAKENKMDGKWVYTLHNPSIMPFLQSCKKRELREKILKAYLNKGNNNNAYDNKENINKIVNLRLERANLLGFKDYASYVLDNNMAKTPEKAFELMNKVFVPALAVAKTEAAELKKMMEKDGIKDNVQPWDWRYYSEKLRKEKYDLDDQALKPYFELNNVRKGLFEVINKLYGLQFVERTDIPTYHPDAKVYEVKEADGSHKAIIYVDFHPRDSKRSGAWMTSFRKQSKKEGKNITPIISVVCNFSKPTADLPSLLTFDEVTTFFHEFGHAIHGMVSNCTYQSLSGTSVPRDFVELPSQVLENWASQPEVMAMYAKHYKTGAPMPKELMERLDNSKYFNQGFETVEMLAAALLDMNYHTIGQKQTIDPVAFENNVAKKIGLISEIPFRYKSTYFNHIFTGGYSAGYYSYIWAEVLDADAFEAFKQHGIFDKATATSFRKNILENGGTIDPMVMYKKFRGAEPSIEPLLKRRGLTK